MNGIYEQNVDVNLAERIEYENIDPSESTFAKELLLTVAIWLPTLLISGIFILLGLPVISVGIAAIAATAHTLLRSSFPVYLLIFIIPIDWMITVIANVTTVSKLVGMIAVILSTPKIITAVFRKWDPCVYWILSLIVWAGIGITWARYPLLALLPWQTMILLWAGLPLLFCAHIKTRVAIEGVLLVFIAGCLISSVGILSSRDIRATLWGQERAKVTSFVGAKVEESEDMNIVGRYLSVAVIISVYMIIVSKSMVKRLPFLGGIIILTAAIILLKGRAIYLALPGAILAGIIMLRGAGIGKRFIIVFAVVIVGLVVGFIVIKAGFLGTAIQQRFESIFEQNVRAGGRIYYWREHIRAFFDSYFRGRGLGMVRWTSTSRKVAHNDWFSIMGDLGLIGLIAFFGFHLTLFIRMQRMTDIWPKFLCLMIWSFMIMAGMTESDYLNKHYALSISMILLNIRYAELQVSKASEILLDYNAQDQGQYL